MSKEAAAHSISIQVERSGDSVTVLLRGRLIAGVSDSFYSEVKQRLPGSKHLVLDLTELTHLDSMGLGAIVRLYVSALLPH